MQPRRAAVVNLIIIISGAALIGANAEALLHTMRLSCLRVHVRAGRCKQVRVDFQTGLSIDCGGLIITS
jgi:hypothetical protein